MKPESILHADLLDIVFENRNKDYGAYVLRKQYPAALQTALTLVIACIIVMGIWFFSSNKSNPITHLANKSMVKKDTVHLSPPPPPMEIPPPPPPRASIDHSTPVIVNEGTDTIPTVEALDQPVAIGSETRSGDTSTLTSQLAPSGDTATGSENIITAPEATPEIYRAVQEMPEFPGGNSALQRFLLKHLRVPDEGLEAGTRITVEVEFVVDKTGSITGMHILRSGGELFNKEVLRVLNKMPVWKPGRQNGMQVPVYFKLPVTFQIQ